MSTSLLEVRDRHRAAQEEVRRDAWKAFKEIVHDTVTGVPVDDSEAAPILDAIGLTDAEIADYEQWYRKRLKFREELSRLDWARQEAIDAQAECDRINAEINAFHESMRPRAELANNRKINAQQVEMAANSARIHLQGECRDPDIIAREKAISAKRTAIHHRMRELDARLDPYPNGTPANILHGLRKKVADRGENEKYMTKYDRDQRNIWLKEIAAIEKQIAGLQSQKQELRQQTAALDAEAKAINNEKLVP